MQRIKYGTIPSKNDLLYKITDNDRIPGIVNRKSKNWSEGDSIYTIGVDGYDVRVVELAISRFMQIKYRGDIDIYDESLVERQDVTNIVAFFSYNALYDFMKALLNMNQKDAEIILSTLLLDFGYSWDIRTW